MTTFTETATKPITTIDSQIYFLRLLSTKDSDIKVSLTGKSKWVDVYEVIARKPLHPISSRLILRNELVFEIDSSIWETVKSGSQEILNTIRKWDAHDCYYLSFSGNNSIHIHVFLSNKGIEFSNQTHEVLKNTDKDEVRKEIKSYVMRQVQIASKAPIDMALGDSRRHMIRLEGSVNEKSGRPCTQIDSIPLEKPGNYGVKIPDTLPSGSWDISFLGKDLDTYLRFHFTKKSRSADYNINFKEIDGPDKFVEILRPVYIEGYRRFIVYSLAGIFKKHGVDQNKAIKIIRELASPDPTIYTTINRIKDAYRQTDPKKIPGITLLQKTIFQEESDGKITPIVAEDILTKLREAMSHE